MTESTAIDWERNTREYFPNKVMEEERQKAIKEGRMKAKLEDALAMLQEGFSLDMIGRITKLPLTEIMELKP